MTVMLSLLSFFGMDAARRKGSNREQEKAWGRINRRGSEKADGERVATLEHQTSQLRENP